MIQMRPDGQEPHMRDSLEASRRFWDEKAKEQPYWYISSFTDYAHTDVDGFWRSGVQIWKDLKAATDYAPSEEHVVLEIGCGMGRLSRAIAPEVGRLVSVDISEEMISLARRENPGLTFERIEGASFSAYENQSFDLVVAYCVWQHLPSCAVLQECLNDAFRVLRPSGRLIFTYSPRTLADIARPLVRLRAAVREFIHPQGPKGLYRREWLGMRPTAAEVESGCHRAGFIDVRQATLHRDKALVSARVVAAR